MIRKIVGVCCLSLLMAACTGTATVSSANRNPIRAGTWYSDDPTRLTRYIDFELNSAGHNLINRDHTAKLAAQNPETQQDILALIVPQAAYKFSGTVAAHAYRLLSGRKFNRVFIIGPMHQYFPPNCLLPSADYFVTPLGKVPVDTDTVKQLSQSPLFKYNEKAHEDDYSIEMQLPFLQRALGQLKIVPILTGAVVDPKVREQIAAALRQVIRPGDLIVVSTNFTAYGARHKWIPFTDNIPENIQAVDKEAYSFIAKDAPRAFVKYTYDSGNRINGTTPIFILLRILPRNTTITLMDYATSWTVPGGRPSNEKPWSVSYVSVAFSGRSWGNPLPLQQPSLPATSSPQATTPPHQNSAQQPAPAKK